MRSREAKVRAGSRSFNRGRVQTAVYCVPREEEYGGGGLEGKATKPTRGRRAGREGEKGSQVNNNNEATVPKREFRLCMARPRVVNEAC